MTDRPSLPAERALRVAGPRFPGQGLRRAINSDWKLACFLITGIGCGVGYLVYVLAYGVTVVFWDAWAWTSFVLPGGTTAGSLWAQHNEARTFFPNLLAFATIHLTKWDDKTLMLLSALLLIGCLGIIVSALWSEIRKAPLLWLPLPFVVLSLAQYQNMLWSYQLAWPLALVSLLASLRLLLKTDLSIVRLCGAIILGVIASYSLLQGLLVWPAGLILLLSRGTLRRWVVVWVAAGAATTAGFFVGFDFAASSTLPLSTVLHHLLPDLRGLLIATGSVIPNISMGGGAIASPLVTETVGALLVVGGLGSIIAWAVAGRPRGGRAFCIALIVVSLLFELLLIPGRLATDPISGASSRYETFSWPLVIGVYGYFAMSLRAWRSERVVFRVAYLAMAAVVAASVVVSTQVGIRQGQLTRTIRLTSADVLANLQTAPTWITGPYLNPPCVTEPENCYETSLLAQTLMRDGFNVFADPAHVMMLRRLGIVPGGEPTRLLPVPSPLVHEVADSVTTRHAWNVLSAVYWTTPSLQRRFTVDRSGLSGLLAWAANSGAAVTPSDMLASQWLPPVSAGFFLKPYLDEYSMWFDQERAVHS